ncbi:MULTISPECIES: orotate phosphoribosyltransferase [unclassified Jeotgalibaca]|uniref:orotate phosphoribosyltransferase n=1 Tax=unclassified Jeotgalibaca TaxID=2621505 RepID=UPI003FD29234
MSTAENVAKALLEIEAVSLSPKEPFTWASGIKSPIYCDNRITISVPKVRTLITDGLVALIKEKYPEAEVIAGTATAGIPHAAFVAQKMDLPMIYIRGKAKDHGKAKRIEGRIQPGQKIVLIEDLISTGGSVIEAAKAAESEGAVVLGCVAIFTYELQKGKENFAESGYKIDTLSNYSTLLKVAQEMDAITAEEREVLKKFSADPHNWNN